VRKKFKERIKMSVTRFADTTFLPRIKIQPPPIEITVLNTATCPSPKTSANTDWGIMRPNFCSTLMFYTSSCLVLSIRAPIKQLTWSDSRPPINLHIVKNKDLLLIQDIKTQITKNELMTYEQAVEKRPSAAFPSSFVVAAYIQVCLTPQDFGRLASGHF
jgi:hypothetical protein